MTRMSLREPVVLVILLTVFVISTFLLGLFVSSEAFGQNVPLETWNPHRYIGRVSPADVHRGDMFTISIENDFGVKTVAEVRLYGFESPALSKSEGRAARDLLARLLDGSPVYLEVVVGKSGRPLKSFERTLVRAWLNWNGELVNIAGVMEKRGMGSLRKEREFEVQTFP